MSPSLAPHSLGRPLSSPPPSGPFASGVGGTNLLSPPELGPGSRVLRDLRSGGHLSDTADGEGRQSPGLMAGLSVCVGGLCRTPCSSER